MRGLFLLGSAAAALLTGCASSPPAQSMCEAKSETFAELVQCTRQGVPPAKLDDPKVKLYLTQGEVLAEHVAAGKKTNAEARAAWQRFAMDMWPERTATFVPIFVPQQPVAGPYYTPVRPFTPAPAPAPLPANTVQAFWTGKSQQATSVTGVIGVNCEYSYAGRTFWRMHQGYCPPSVEAR